MIDFDALKNAMGDLEEDDLNALLEQAVADPETDIQKVVTACQDGMEIVGKRFEEGEYFVGDLIFAGEILTNGMEIIKPALGGSGAAKVGKLILCTVEGDLHDIGKNIVKGMLEASGFEVIDLGIDTPAEKIIEEVKANDVSIVALSGVLTLALDAMKKTVDAMKAAGLRDGVKVIVGGAPVNEAACAVIGADEWALSPQKTVNVCRKWAEA